MKKQEDVNFQHARKKEQIMIMKKALENKNCPFCWDVIEKYHPKKILKKGNWWWLSENGWFYEGAEIQFIFFYKKHIATIKEIETEAFTELHELIKWVEETYKLKWCSLFIRSGEMNGTGSSVQHIHAQLISGNSTKREDSEALKVKLGYKKKK